MRTILRPRPVYAATLLLLAAGGCSTGSNDRFVPSAATARDALQAALDAWKAGQPLGRIDSHKPPIEVLAAQFNDGPRLVSYEITGQDTNAEGHHRFRVKLTMEPPAETEEATFIVLGLDPLWVYGEEDYAKLSGT